MRKFKCNHFPQHTRFDRVGVKNINITKIMIQDHSKIAELLFKFNEIEKINHLAREVAFDLFKWELEKHFFTEDRAIFLYYQPKDEFDKKEIQALHDEHAVILKKFDELEKSIKSKKNLNIEDFGKLLHKHRKHEDAIIYPKLDQYLDEKVKKIIINRINHEF